LGPMTTITSLVTSSTAPRPHRRQAKHASEKAGYPDRLQEEFDRVTTAVCCYQPLELCLVLVALTAPTNGGSYIAGFLTGSPLRAASRARTPPEDIPYAYAAPPAI